MFPDCGHGGQCTIDAFAGDVVGDMAMGLGPSQDRADSLAKFARGLRLHGPDRRQHAQHVLASDPVHAHVAERREGVPLQLLQPVFRDLGITLARPVRIEGPFRRFPECRYPGAALRFPWIAAGPCEPAILEGLVPGFGETHQRKSTQTVVATLTVDSESLDPTFRSTGCDGEIERASVAMQARFEQRTSLRHGEPSHISPTK